MQRCFFFWPFPFLQRIIFQFPLNDFTEDPLKSNQCPHLCASLFFPPKMSSYSNSFLVFWKSPHLKKKNIRKAKIKQPPVIFVELNYKHGVYCMVIGTHLPSVPPAGKRCRSPRRTCPPGTTGWWRWPDASGWSRGHTLIMTTHTQDRKSVV